MIPFGAFIAVKSENLQVGDAEFVAVMGPTGCGKSTILSTATGLSKPASGDVQIFGKPLTGLNDQSGYMLQQGVLLPWKTAQDNVGLGLAFLGKSLEETRAEVRQWPAKVGLTGFEQRYPHQLSGGQRKRAAMAQTLIMEPRIVLMDEPFSTLDVHTRRLTHRILPDLWQAERRSLIFITHHFDEAITLADPRRRDVRRPCQPDGRRGQDHAASSPGRLRAADQDEFVALYREIWSLLGR